MKNTKTIAILFAVIITGLLLAACQTVPQDIPEGISQQEFFQRAQEFTDDLNYDAALVYLEEFKIRYPEDQFNGLAADYQIALINYKQNNFRDALTQFQDIIERYESAEAGTYPEWVNVLSQRLLEKIEENQG